MARWIDSWLAGSPGGTEPRRSSGEAAAPDVSGHPGSTFGLPAGGVNAIAGLGRRFVAIFLDWILAYLIALAFLGSDGLADPNIRWIVLAIWYVITVLGVATIGMTPGKVAAGYRVARTDMAQFVGVPKAMLRTALIVLVLPALARDHDGRGWQDRASTTIATRTR